MSEYLERMIGRARRRDFFDRLPESLPPVERTESQSVHADRFDQAAWAEMVGMLPALREQVDALTEIYPTSPEAYADLFQLLNQGDPRFTEAERMRSEYLAQHHMLSGLAEAEDIKWLRNETKYDAFGTALTLLSMEDRMRDAFDRMREAAELAKAIEQALQDALAAAQQALASGQGEQDAADALEAAMQAAAAGEDESTEAGRQAAMLLELAAGEARDELESQQQLAQAYGLNPGQLKRMPFDERKALADRLNASRMKQLANLIGRFRLYADGERRRKLQHAPAERYDVTTGDNLSRMLSSELTNLAVEELEDVFWLRYAKQGLLQWEVRGVERSGKGPILVLCDESGSMGATLDGEGNTREAWSKALSLSLADQARTQGRDFIYVGFASSREQWQTGFTGGKATPEQLIEFTEHFYGGGTSYYEPLTRAMEIIEEYRTARGQKMPDVVLITDAECHVRPDFVEQWQQVREAADVRCYGLQIGGRPDATSLAEISDRTMQISAANASPEGMVDLFRTL